MQKAKKIGDRLIMENGSVLSDEIGTNDPSKKHFAAVVMCGHVGEGFFIPILFSVQAKDLESAKLVVQNSPRVKIHVKGCILGIKEISEIESYFIRTINLHDPYIVYSAGKNIVDRRKILTPERLEKECKRVKNLPKNKLLGLGQAEIDVKLADNYPENFVIQRYFAPRKQGRQIVFPKHVDMDLFLRDYFVERTKYLGLKRALVPILVEYYKTFGPNNQLGVTIDDNKVSFVNNDGEKCELELDEFSSSLMDLKDDTRLFDALKSKEPNQEGNFDNLEGHARSGLERFRARWQKTLQDGEGK